MSNLEITVSIKDIFKGYDRFIYMLNWGKNTKNIKTKCRIYKHLINIIKDNKSNTSVK